MASERLGRWARDYVLLVELFALGNLCFLALDIYIAHLENGFLRRAEYAPLFLFIGRSSAAVRLLLSRANWWGKPAVVERNRIWRGGGRSRSGWGLAGVIYHLDGQFFLRAHDSFAQPMPRPSRLRWRIPESVCCCCWTAWCRRTHRLVAK